MKFTPIVALIKPNKMVKIACPGKFAFKSYGIKCAKKFYKNHKNYYFSHRAEKY